MSGRPNLPVDQIAKIADDIREIKDYAENHGFDAGLFNVSVRPATKSSAPKASFDWPLWLMVGFFLGVVGIAAALIFVEALTSKQTTFAVVVGLLFVVVATMSTHLKFKNGTVTFIAAFGACTLLLVGAGLITPKEALDGVKGLKE